MLKSAVCKAAGRGPRFQRNRMSLNSKVAVMRPHMVEGTYSAGLVRVKARFQTQRENVQGRPERVGAGRWAALRVGANDHQIPLSACFFLQVPKNMATAIETTANVAMRITSIIGPALNHTRASLSNLRSDDKQWLSLRRRPLD